MKQLISLYMKDMSDEEIFNWYSKFEDIECDVFYKTIDNINNQTMPNAIQLRELCEATEVKNTFDILDKMWADGYFKKSPFGELSPEQQSRNFEKAIMWLNKGIIPEWLLEDMIAYGYKPITEIETKPQPKLISGE